MHTDGDGSPGPAVLVAGALTALLTITACGGSQQDEGPVAGTQGPVVVRSGTPTEVVITDDGANGTLTASPPSGSSTPSAGQSGPPSGLPDDSRAGNRVPTGSAPAIGPAQGGGPIAVLSVIRATGQAGFDRVVFELDGPVPGYRVQYVRTVLSDPAGAGVPVTGAAFLQVTLQQATLDDSAQGGDRGYTGPGDVPVGLEAVRQVVVSGDFEAVLSFGVGLAGRLPFTVSTLTDPSRIVLDVAHRSA